MEFATMALIILLQSFDGLGIQDFLLGIRQESRIQKMRIEYIAGLNRIGMANGVRKSAT